MLVSIANREDPDQTASSEVVRFGSALFVKDFLAGKLFSKFRTVTILIHVFSLDFIAIERF